MPTPILNLEYVVKGQDADIYTTNINNNLDILDSAIGSSGALNIDLSTLAANQVLIYSLTGGVHGKWSNYSYSDAGIASKTTADAHYAKVVVPSSTDTTRDKHLSNKDYKVVYDHTSNTSNPHSVTHTQVGSATAQWNANKIQGVTVDDTNKANKRVLYYNSTSGNIEYIDVNAVKIQDITVNTSGITSGQGLIYNGTNFVAGDVAGVDTLLELTDITDSSYTGKSGQVLKVNALETAMELGTVSAGNVDGGSAPTVGDLITLRNSLDSVWVTYGSTVIQNGNIALSKDTTTGFYSAKIGNGSTQYSSLPFAMLPFKITSIADKHKLRYVASTKTFDNVLDNLDGLSNINITSALNNDVLAYDNATSKWINKPIRKTITEVSTTYTILSSDDVILADGTFDVTLPSAVGLEGKEYVIKNVGSGAITVYPDGSETIDGSASVSLASQYDSVRVVSNDVVWYEI